MLCSTIITTIGRHTLSRAVNSVLDQSFDQEMFEVIVVNDSGKPLKHADWQESPIIQVLNTNCRERSIARNTGAATALGKYLHFLDDDDWLLPNAFLNFWESLKNKSPAWVYGGSQLVDRDGRELIELRHGINGNGFLHAMSGEWIPLQSSLIDSSLFHEVGGFNPLITGPEDIDLLRRITLHGNILEVNQVVACIEMGRQGSTTDYLQHPEASRFAREEILKLPGVFKRMREGVRGSFWLGKLSRIYLTSVIWNINHGRFWTALSRLFHAFMSAFSGGYKVFSPRYWQSLTTSYKSFTFERGIREVEIKSKGG